MYIYIYIYIYDSITECTLETDVTLVRSQVFSGGAGPRAPAAHVPWPLQPVPLAVKGFCACAAAQASLPRSGQGNGVTIASHRLHLPGHGQLGWRFS